MGVVPKIVSLSESMESVLMAIEAGIGVPFCLDVLRVALLLVLGLLILMKTLQLTLS